MIYSIYSGEFVFYYNIMDLYTNIHPETTMKGTGFKNENSAKKTIDIIKYRSTKYQFDVINTMYNRAKYHPNQTSNMRKAMKIFKNWLKKYKKEKILYPYLPLQIIEKFNLNNKFIKQLKKVKGKYYKLQYIPIGKYDFLSYRNKLINNILQKKPKLFFNNGKITKKHLKLISLGYSPYPNKL